MPIARYFRFTGFNPYGGGDIEISEFALYELGTRADTAAMLTATIAPTTGSIASLSDESFAGTVRWSQSAYTVGGFALLYDLGSSKNINEVRIGSGSLKAEFLRDMMMQTSNDGIAWEAFTPIYGINWPGAGGSVVLSVGSDADPFFDRVGLLLHGDGANGSTTIVDSSHTPKTVTANGNAQISTAQSRFGGASVAFDGANDYLSIPYASSLDLTGGDSTVEGWAMLNGTSGFHTFIDFRGSGTYTVSWVIFFNAANRSASIYNGPSQATVMSTPINSLPVANTWFHIAVVVSGGTTTIYINGSPQATGSYTPPSTHATGVRIGVNNDLNDDFFGYMDEVRITKGVARYTANFTPMSQAFSNEWADASANSVVLLLHGDGANGSTVIADSSSNSKTVTLGGNVQISTAQSRFGGASIYFDGAGDFLALAAGSGATPSGTEDFTLECWAYAPSLPSAGNIRMIANVENATDANQGVINLELTSTGAIGLYLFPGNLYTSGGSFTANTWHHVALSRAGNSFRLFLNGQQVGTTQTAAISFGTVALNIGYQPTVPSRAWLGHIDELRLTRTVARYTANFTAPPLAFPNPPAATGTTALWLHFDGANGSTSFVDSGPNVFAGTASGNAALSTAQAKFGSSALYLDGSGDILSYASNSAFDLGTSDFTIECFYYEESASNGALISRRSSSTAGWVLQTQGLRGVINSIWSDSHIGWTRGSFNAWHHFAWVRSGSNMYIFLDGALVGSRTGVINVQDEPQPVRFGVANNGTENFFKGWIDEFRWTKGAALYKAAFTPPNAPFGVAGATGARDLLTRSEVSPQLASPYAPPAFGAYFNAMVKGLHRMDFQGDGVIAATVKQKGEPVNLPIRRHVYCMDMLTGTIVDDTWSDAVTGEYTFLYLDRSRKYTVFSYDHTLAYRATIADSLTPEKMS